MALLPDLTSATDPKLRELAKRLAAQLFLDVSRRGPVRPRGTGKLASLPFTPEGGVLDIYQSLEALSEAFGSNPAIDPDRLRVRGWAKPGTALCLLVDRSGSMSGRPLAPGARAASAGGLRAPGPHRV